MLTRRARRTAWRSSWPPTTSSATRSPRGRARRVGPLRGGPGRSRTPWMDLSVRVDRIAARGGAAARGHPRCRRRRARRTARRRVRVARRDAGGAAAAEWLGVSGCRSWPSEAGTVHVGYGRTRERAALPRDAARLPSPRTIPARAWRRRTRAACAWTTPSGARSSAPDLDEPPAAPPRLHPLPGLVRRQARAATSILSVSRAPGLPFVYLGTVLIGVGALWMSFLKRWVARRQGGARWPRAANLAAYHRLSAGAGHEPSSGSILRLALGAAAVLVPAPAPTARRPACGRDPGWRPREATRHVRARVGAAASRAPSRSPAARR